MTEQQQTYLENFRSSYNETESLSIAGATLAELAEWKENSDFREQIVLIAREKYDAALSYFINNMTVISVAERKLALERLMADMGVQSPQKTQKSAPGKHSKSMTDDGMKDWIESRKPVDD